MLLKINTPPDHAPAPPSSPTFLISATLNVSPALPSKPIALTRVTSPPPKLSAKKIATEFTEVNLETFSCCGVPSFAASALNSNSASAGSDSASEKPIEGLLTKRRTLRGAVSASGALIEMEVILTAERKKERKKGWRRWWRGDGVEVSARKKAVGVFFFPRSSHFLPHTLRKRNVDQQLLVSVRLQEEACVLAVSLFVVFGFGFVCASKGRKEVRLR